MKYLSWLVLLFLILAKDRLEANHDTSWWIVFSPLFALIAITTFATLIALRK